MWKAVEYNAMHEWSPLLGRGRAGVVQLELLGGWLEEAPVEGPRRLADGVGGGSLVGVRGGWGVQWVVVRGGGGVVLVGYEAGWRMAERDGGRAGGWGKGVCPPKKKHLHCLPPPPFSRLPPGGLENGGGADLHLGGEGTDLGGRAFLGKPKGEGC